MADNASALAKMDTNQILREWVSLTGCRYLLIALPLMMHNQTPDLERLRRLRLSLDGLSLGDCFGQQFFHRNHWSEGTNSRQLPPAPWKYTDDTEMALAIADILHEHGTINQDLLAMAFATRYAANPYRGYGSGAHDVLSAIGSGKKWRTSASSLFDGQGSLGNGGAMRSAPLGAYFADEIDEVVSEQARLAAEVTHAHAEGVAGAVAVAVAAAHAARCNLVGKIASPVEMFEAVLNSTPPGATRDGIERAAKLPLNVWQHHAAEQLGNGSRITAADTVPFCLWIIARHVDDFTEALWNTVHVGGDIDTNCAIIGGVLACAVGANGLPNGWMNFREPLDWHGRAG